MKNFRIDKQRKIAGERIEKLFSLAESSSQKLADSYVDLARKISMKVNLRLPSSIKRRFCKNCGAYFRQGVNCRVRTRNGKVIYYCFNCKRTYRIPFLKEKKKIKKVKLPTARP